VLPIVALKGKLMDEIKIPHAERTFEKGDPPHRILHVFTELPRESGRPGFDAVAWFEMLKAIREKEKLEGFDGHEIHTT
jgi:hypothetical protein